MRILSSDEDLEELSVDAGIIKLRPRLAYVAQTEEEVAMGLREAASRGLAVTPRGAGTSIPSQSVGSGAIILQSRAKAKVQGDGAVACQPGLVKAELNRLLSALGRWMPVDPSSYASCTVGGMVANNSSGIRTPKYGSTVDYVIGVRATVPGEEAGPVEAKPMDHALGGDRRTRRVASLIIENQSSIIQERPRVTKNSSGYRLEKVFHDGILDFPKLFVGSEGTLGIMTEVTLATRTRPRWRLLFIVEASLVDLNDVVDAFRGHSPTAIELLDKSVFRTMNRWDMIAKYSRSESPYLVFCEFDGLEGDSFAKVQEVASSKAGAYDPLVLTDPSEILEAWEVRNETLTLALQIRDGTKVLVPGVEDIVVPPDRLTDLVKLLKDQFESRGLRYISYGHAADANIHARPLLDLSDRSGRATLDELMEECFEAAWKMGGSMTGEHGDGMLRAKYVEKQYPKTYWIMREIKNLYDPKGLLNPGVKIGLPEQP